MSSRSALEKIECTLDRWVNGRAILVFQDGQEFTIARRFLPKTAAEGQVFELQFLTQEAAANDREALARAILKEILSG